MRKVNTFVPIESKVDRAVPKLAARSSKRAVEEELDQESSKRQKTGESSEQAEEPRDKEADERSQEELQQMMIIVLDGVHHVSTEKGIDIYMLVEKGYPLSRGTLKLMLVAKLFVDQDNEMSRELLRKIFMQIKLLIKKLEDLEGINVKLGSTGEQREVLDSMARDFSCFTTWIVTGLSRMMDHARVRYTSDLDFQSPYQRRVRRRTDDANTLALQQPDP
ncbi:hypothetical protein Tco_1052747 [Tanacetum coccineum]